MPWRLEHERLHRSERSGRRARRACLGGSSMSTGIDEFEQERLRALEFQRQQTKEDEDDRPLPDLPPLPADPRWRVAHLPFLTTVSFALLLFAASAGFLTGGAPSALGAAL